MKKIVMVLLVLSLFSLSMYCKDLESPKNISIIGQTATATGGFLITVVDLENNELVILEFFPSRGNTSQFALIKVIRTGSIVDVKNIANQKN